MAATAKESTHPSSPASALPIKTSGVHQRHHSAGVGHPTHRVTRRKSMSATAGTNLAAVAAAVKEAADVPFFLPDVQAGDGGGDGGSGGGGGGGGGGIGKPNGKTSDGANVNGYPSPPSSLPTPGLLNGNSAVAGGFQVPKKGASTLLSGSAIADGHAPEIPRPSARNRRASEGAGPALGTKGTRVRSGSELKCDKCGKGYKHSSCLTKHLWEHTPEWQYTSKLLISKHQQVQLLEAASILVSMNPTPPPSSAASNDEGRSPLNDTSSSDETTPPPGADLTSPAPTPRNIRNGAGKPGKRYSSGSFSRSYNSVSQFLAAGSAPTAPAFPHHMPQRPRPRAGSSVSQARTSVVASSPILRSTSSAEDDALAAAVELLSCSFHTPKIAPTALVGSVPRGGLSELGSPPAGGRSYLGPLNDVVEMKREEESEAVADVDMDELREEEEEELEAERWNGRGKSEDDEDGVFGRMEE